MITLRPVGGLCNRVLAIDSMIRVCERIKKDLKIIWIINRDLGASFESLYQPIQHKAISIEVIDISDQPLLYSDRLLNNPRQKVYNSLLKLYQHFSFDGIFHASETKRLKSENFPFTSLGKYSHPYVSSWTSFDDKPFSPEYFKPTEEIKKHFPKFKSATIGVHIRRTDHTLAILQSPLEKFTNAMNQELKNNPDIQFFVASDSAEIKLKLIGLFGDKVIVNSSVAADRSSSAGMLDAMIDLYGLANTTKVIGNSISTFTRVASEINGIELININK